MIEILTLLLKIISTLYFIGYGFTAVFIPKRLREDSFFLIPWIGLILITAIGITLSMLQIPLAQSKYVILAFASLMLIYSFLKKKAIFRFSKDTVFLSISAIICLIFNLYPLLIKVGYSTTISLSNLDPLFYVNLGEYLINHSVLIRPEVLSTQTHLKAVEELLYNYRWGSPLILSFFSSLFNIRSYRIYSILITLFFSLSVPLVYLLAKLLINRSSKLLIFLVFLTYGMNSVILDMLYNVFFAQFIFIGIFILAVILLYSYLADLNIKNLRFNSYDLLIGLCISSLTSIYPEGLIFVILPVSAFMLLKLFSKERFVVFISLLKIAALSLIFNPYTMGTALYGDFKLFFSSTKTSFIGWEKIPYSSPLEMTGFYNLFYYKNLPMLLSMLINIPIIGICLYGLFKIKNKLLMISYLLIFGLFYIAYWIIFPNYYLHLKLVTYLLFIFVALFSIGLFYLFRSLKNKLILLSIIIVFTFLSIRSAYRTIYQLYYHARVVDKKLMSLEQLNNDKKIKSAFFTADVFLGEYDLWKRLWQEYLLSNKEIITKTNYLEEKKFKNNKLVLSEKDIQEYDHKKITYKNIIWDNEYYKLGEIK
jgi:hypothetical protein